MSRSWTIEELRAALERFRADLEAARLCPASVRTYVDRTEVFLRWLAGEYHPRGPVS